MIEHNVLNHTVFELPLQLDAAVRADLRELGERFRERELGVIPECGTRQTWVGSDRVPTNRLHLLRGFSCLTALFERVEVVVTTVAHGFVDGEDRSPHAHYLNHSWYSITPPGGFVRSHTHSNRNFVSGVYYPHAPADSGALIFQERDNRRVVQEEQELNISSDHLYLFPGSLAHRTSPNLGDGDKTAISFDYMLLRPDKDLPPGDLVARAWEDIEQQSSILELGLKTLSSEDENP